MNMIRLSFILPFRLCFQHYFILFTSKWPVKMTGEFIQYLEIFLSVTKQHMEIIIKWPVLYQN
jgi:hypothetical protein